MKRLLLIDDESIARNHIKEAFPWEEWGFTVVGEATNGVEALEMLEALAPDIALIDITMPVMDGLTVLKQMNNRSFPTKFIVLTAHREFSYVKQAMENGAVGYILKSPINLAETKAALDKALRESEKDSRLLSVSQNQMTIQTNRYPLRKHYFQQILIGLYDENLEIVHRGHDIGVQLEDLSYMLVLGEVDRLRKFCNRYSNNDHMLIEFSMLEIIRESLQDQLPMKVEIFPLQLGRVALLLSTHEGQLSKESCVEICLRLEQSIQAPLHNYLDIRMKLVASEPFHQPKQIRSTYNKIDSLFIYRFYQEKPKTIFDDGLYPFTALSEVQWMELNEFAAPLQEGASSAISLKNTKKLELFFLRSMSSPSDVIQWFQSLEPLLSHTAHSPEWPDFTEAESLFEAVHLLLEWLQQRDRLITHSFAVRPEIARAIQYILQHLGDELTLEVISSEAGLSTSHFSHLFKKEVGMSVIDYVLEQRVKLAKQLLVEGKLRNYELAEQVGFQHYSYFSNMFKKITGMSPNEFRRSSKSVITDLSSI